MALKLTRADSVCNSRGFLLAMLPVFLAGALTGFLATRGRGPEHPPAVNTDSGPSVPKARAAEPEPKLPRPAKADPDAPRVPAPIGTQRWEYKALALEPLDTRKPDVIVDTEKQADNYTKAFNKLGQDEWEYHSTIALFGNFAIFRRPLSPPQ